MKLRLSVLVILAGVFFSLYQCKDHKNTGTYLNHNDSVAYVGMDACKSCHYQIFETFQHTGMGQSFHYATNEKSSALFGREHQVFDSVSNFYYYPFWRNDSLFIREFRLENNDTTHSLEKYINYIVGSGHHTNSHLIFENNFVYQAPITFYVQQQKWDLAPGFENGNNSRFSRILNSECVSCHNSMPKMGRNEFEFQELGLGIDCERCHGPGELHVNIRSKGKGVDAKKQIDPTIVNPKKLAWELQIDLCQRCHLQGLNVLKPDKDFTDFKPGMQLSTIFEIFLPKYSGDSHFDMANHSDRLQRSQCFIVSNQKEHQAMTCITCHNPHISVAQLEKNYFNQTCEGCHQEKKCSEKHDILVQNDNNCVKCHMPVKGAEDIPHVTVHDHYIQKPINEKQKEQVTQLLGLYSVNNAKTDKKTMIQAYLEYWEKFDKNPFYLKKARALLDKTKHPEMEIKYHFLNEQFSKVIEWYEKNSFEYQGWTLYTVAVSYHKLKRTKEALSLISFARTSEPLHIDLGKFHLKLLLQQQQWPKAFELSEKMHKLYPNDTYFNSSLGRLFLMQNQLGKAKKHINYALKLDPDDLNNWETQLNYFVQIEDYENAKYWAKKILNTHPNHPDRSVISKFL
jgi:hypothetical protein